MTRYSAALLAAAGVLGVATATAIRAQQGPAYFVRSLQDPSDRREARPDILDTPVLPGSIMKVVTLVAAIEAQVIEPQTARMCRRTVVVGGRSYTCSHPDLKRPLTAAEALAYSCNDYFVSLAPRLTRAAFNEVRTRLGLPPVTAETDLAASFVGLDGPRITPRALLDVIARLAGADVARPVAVSPDARRVLVAGLRGAAEYGTASSLKERRVSALAKTGTAPMPGGSFLGLVVALEPADKPTRGAVIVAPGAAGADAAVIAADVLVRGRGSPGDGGRPGTEVASVGDGGRPGTEVASVGDGGRRGTEVAPRPVATTDSKTVAPASGASPKTVRVSINGRVNTLDLEEYVARVVAGEGQPRAADGAQQALAITARTFAVANLNRHRREGYNLCDTTHCQVMRAATDISRRAAQQTAGKVLTHQGQPATVFYSAWCGGHSELASEVWPGAVDYSSDRHEDEACRDEPPWSNEVRVHDIERALRQAGHRGDRLRDLRILQKNASGRVTRIRVDGFTPNELSGHDFRMAIGRVVGWQHLKSTAFTVRRLANGYRFDGIGYGHGVGLCVIGAGNRAARGQTAAQILAFYFPSLKVESDSGAAATPAVAATPHVAATAPAPRPAGDVLLALPGSEELERSRIAQLIRAARDDIAAKAGLKAPPVIRATVHPTVESFARATGQPWWVSGATDGAAIDLLPLTLLRQRGQVERTIRHEVAHVLIDATLKGRPLWVREGGAFYFADPNSTETPPTRASCPADEEFLKPLSAGTHRAAYARAEACFRRAIAQGKRWSEIR
jgi:SpoIID/LytB domain protein